MGKIRWDKSLIYDANTNSSPLAACINKDANGIFVITKIGLQGTFLAKGSRCVLWEIRDDGQLTKQPVLLRDGGGNMITTDALTFGYGCAMVADSNDNLLTVGMLGARNNEISIANILTANVTKPKILTRNPTYMHNIAKLMPFQNNTFILVGGRNGDGVLQQINNQGKILREDQFDNERNECFTGVDLINSNSSSLAVVGSSIKLADANSADNFILIYDPNYKIIHEDWWKSSVSGFALVTARPKICCLGDASIVVYNRESGNSKICLWARCYTQELKILWEKEIYCIEKSSGKLPFYFDISTHNSMGFVVAIITPAEGLGFYSFDVVGNKVGYSEYKGMIGSPGFNLTRMNGRTMAIFEESSGYGKIKDITIKAKVIALD